jgi:hypothetical protein
MKLFYRILSVLTLFALMLGPALVTAAQAQDDQQYNSSTDMQPAPDDQPAAQPDATYDEAPADQQAQPAPAAPDAESSAQANVTDPPTRAARLQYMEGSISIQPQGTGEWVAGELNRPLTNSDNIWADKNSRAEISVGTGVIRIGSETSLTLTDIAENVVQLQLHQGALNLHVRRLYDNEKYEVDTPNQAFTVEKPGDYRFDVNPDTDKTVITVWNGEGESTGDGPTVHIHANEQVLFSNGTSMTVQTQAAPAPDNFDQWASARDRKLDDSQSARYVSPDVVGSDDLDEYGVWKETPDYGAVWYPTVAPGWAPYYDGHWVYEYPWGWTWVDYEPWGFAPFHYGRWVYWGGGWGWAPGPIYVRPYYAPALVAWFGGGWGVGVGVGFGWCPLGWGEPFIPWYHASFGYFRGVNITNTRITNVNITNIYNNTFVNGRYSARNGYQIHYANMRRPGGFTAVSRDTLVNSRPVAHNNLRVSPNQMSRMTPVHSLGLSPTRASIVGARGRGAAPPARAFARPVVSRMSAPKRAGFNGGARAGINARPGFNGTARGTFNSNVARPQGSQRAETGANANGRFNNSQAPRTGAMTGTRSVPRPPSAGFGNQRAGGFANRGSQTLGNRGAETFGNRGPNAPANGRYSAPQMSRNSVPRPPAASMSRGAAPYSRGGSPAYSSRGASPSYSPRPAAPSSAPRGGFSAPRPSPPAAGSRSGPRGAMNVPRPAGSFGGSSQAANRESFGGSRSVPRPSASVAAENRVAESYGRSNYGGSYGRSMPAYGGSSSYGSRTPSFGGGYGRPSESYSGSYGRPSYGAPSGRSSAGRSMSMPSYSRNYGGGMPSYGASRPSYGGGFGGGRSAGSFGGGRAYSGGGGGHFGGFGGGGHSGGGFGGHFGGGGGGHSSGGGHSGGGGHGGRH